MKKIIIIISSVVVLVLGLVFFGGNETQIIDVRTPEEYATSHANGAINIPLATIQTGDYSKIHKNALIKVYCRSGKRAAEAKAILEKAGYKEVANIGGLVDWQDNGGSVCETTKPTC